ncbi:hypothetical protein GGD41_007448 [Paraburkholderia bryophila]|uniref:Uncharacterized protein n=1 Tax=Paraburkholderia bryophila TaxID=420952 RepID=A0A7Y9WGY4_9BURK|nr:hypothetical protein [Paraburkholderia bryophila]
MTNTIFQRLWSGNGPPSAARGRLCRRQAAAEQRQRRAEARALQQSAACVLYVVLVFLFVRHVSLQSFSYGITRCVHDGAGQESAGAGLHHTHKTCVHARAPDNPEENPISRTFAL